MSDNSESIFKYEGYYVEVFITRGVRHQLNKLGLETAPIHSAVKKRMGTIIEYKSWYDFAIQDDTVSCIVACQVLSNVDNRIIIHVESVIPGDRFIE